MTLKYINSVSRNLTAKDRSWETVVFQDGKSVLDSELNLAQEISRRPHDKTYPSGVVSTYPISSEKEAFIFSNPEANTLKVRSFVASIAGEEIIIAGSNDSSAVPLYNKISLPAPSTGGSPPDSKRTDFVFLEIWKQLVTSSASASAILRLTSNSITDVNLDGTGNGGGLLNLVAGSEFTIGADVAETARNIRDYLNLASSSTTLGISVSAETNGTEFIFLTFGGGSQGNNITITGTGDIEIKPSSGGSDGEGQPNANKVYPYGNVQADASNYLDDDIVDPFLNEQTTRRVQIQYRFRVFSQEYNGTTHVEGISPKTHFYGFDNTNVLAQGGTGSAVAGYSFSRADGNDVLRLDGNTNSYPYTDSGLFYCGDGSQTSATALGTVDGYVYAVPICYVFRKYEGIFDPENYTNQGLLSTHVGTNNNALNTDLVTAVPATKSDRPDGQFSDIIYETDILDLRRRTFPYGIDFSSEIVRQFQLLLDNSNNTWAMDSSDFRPLGNASGGISTTPLVCDEIGRSVLNGGVGTTAQRGSFVRQFDHIARRFSNTPTLERVIFEVKYDVSEDYDGALSVTKNGASGWYEGDVISFDIAQLEASSDSRYWGNASKAGLLVSDCWPTGTKAVDVLRCWHDDGNTANDISQNLELRKVEGLGDTTISLTLDRNLNDVDIGNGTKMVGNATVGDIGSDRSIFITLLFEYPEKNGTSATPLGEDLSPDSSVFTTGSVVEYRVDQRPSDSVGEPPEIFYREGYREVCLEMVNNSVSVSLVTEGLTGVRLPWKIHYSDSQVPTVLDTDGVTPIQVDFNNSKFGSSDTFLAFQNQLGSQRLVTVSSYPKTPVSNYGAGGYQVACYYRSVAPQTCGSKDTPTNAPSEITVTPIIISDKLWSITHGGSTLEEGYPYSAPFEQIGTNPLATDYTSEADLLSSTFISLEDFSVNTGMLAQANLVSIDQTVQITFKNPSMDQNKRVVYREVDADSYMPSTYARKLAENIRHKNACPMLCVVGTNNTLYRKGEVVLVVISRISDPLDTGASDPSRDNFVSLTTSTGDTVACIYRTSDLVLTGERSPNFISVVN